MTTPPDFDFVSAKDFPALADAFGAEGHRRINSVHLHHSVVLNKAVYEELAGPKDDMGVWAGKSLCQRMWRMHTVTRNWVDIAQHVTIDPAGRIWLCRDWDMPPASVAGLNGTSTLGPFMIQMIGDFDIGHDTPTTEQWAATCVVAASIQRAFGRDADDVFLHSEMAEHATCPGASLDRETVVKTIAAAHAKLPKPIEQKEGVLAKRERHVHQLLSAAKARVGEAGAGAKAPNYGDELDECCAPNARNAELLLPADRAIATRGGGGDDDGVSTEMFRQMKKHLVHLRSGAFVEDGDFATTELDVEEMVAGIIDWAKALPRGTTPRLMIHAHGGLTSAEHGLDYAWTMHRWWLEHHVYPVYFIWETGVMETVMQVLGLTAKPEERGLFDDIADRAVEGVVRTVGQPFWNQMKVSAELSADGRREGGSYVLAKLLSDKLKARCAPKLEIHAVGHSAGAIFHSYLLEKFKVPVTSLTLMAPAVSVDLFNDKVKPLVKNGDIGRLHVMNLDREHERRDDTVPAYSKSLLYLVSRGFEPERGEAILGLEESIRQDRDLARFLGIGASSANTRVTWCPNTDNPQGRRSRSKVHGDFDNDQDTMRSVLWNILGGPTPDVTREPPAEPAQRAAGRPLFTSLTDRLQELWPELYKTPATPAAPAAPAAPSQPPAPLPTGPASGTRRALCIGIDDYGGQYDLGGCIADAELWQSTLQGIGFITDILTDRSASRDGIMSGIRKLLDDSKPGDIAVLHYSGHGTYFDDLNGDEADGQDEAWVPFDGLSDGNYLIDDDIRSLLANHLTDGVECTLFIDCCHSGTSSRFAKGRPNQTSRYKERFIRPTREMQAMHAAARDRMAHVRTAPEGGQENMRHVQFSACQDAQTAKESGGHGWFTKAATDALREGAKPTNTALLERIEQMFVQRGHVRNDQNPLLDCRQASRAARLLGGLVQ